MITVNVERGRILICASFADVLRVQRIPGAQWDGTRNGWVLPATFRNASRVRSLLPKMSATAAFSVLADAKPKPTPPAAPEVAQSSAVCEIAAPQQEAIIPAGLRVQPWRHQVDGYTFGIRALRQHRAVLLAAQMGVGKTFVATMLALGLDAQMVLIACPLRVIGSWKVQLAQYLAEPYVIAALNDDLGTVAKRVEHAREKLELARVTRRRFFLVTNYDVLWRDPLCDWLLEQRWDALILDESHKIKSPGGRASLMAKRLLPRVANRILATGTPLAHSPLDIFAQFRAAAPSVFGPSFAAFKAKYAKLGGPARKWVVGFQNTEDLEQRMAPLTWRCTKREALPDLPEEQEVEYSTELGPEATRIYRQLERDMITEIEGRTLTAANCLTKILRLQQLTGGSLPTDDRMYHKVDDGKRKLLTDTLEDLGGQPAIIFCRFRSDIDAAHEACKAAGVESLELSGTRNELERWQGGEAQALVVQMQSGSVGITLVRASVAIYYSLSTSLAEYDQSRSRIHRPGQKRNCQYVYLTCQGTIDQRILAALRARQSVIEAIMQSIAAMAAKR